MVPGCGADVIRVCLAQVNLSELMGGQVDKWTSGQSLPETGWGVGEKKDLWAPGDPTLHLPGWGQVGLDLYLTST